MSGFFGQICIVEIQIADHGAIREGRKIRRCPDLRSPQRGSFAQLSCACHAAGDPAGLSRPCPEGTGNTIKNPALDLMNDRGRKCLVA